MNLRADGWGGSSARARPRADQQWRRGRATVTRGRATGRGGGAARRTRWGGWPGEEAAAPDATGSAARMRGSGGSDDAIQRTGAEEKKAEPYKEAEPSRVCVKEEPFTAPSVRLEIDGIASGSAWEN